MPIQAVQRFIYRNFVQRSKVNKVLDCMGRKLNRIGLPYATGLTRNKSILFASNDPAEIQNARDTLLETQRDRAFRAVGNCERLRAGLLKKTTVKDIQNILKARNILDPEFAFKAIPAALEAAQKANLSPDQILRFFGKIVRKKELKTSFAFHALPSALKANLTPTQILKLFGKIAVKTDFTGPDPLFYLPAALEAAQKANLAPAQIHNLFGKIVNNVGMTRWYVFMAFPEAGYVFKALPAAFEAAQKAKLTPDQILSLFGWIAKKMQCKNAFEALPAALEAAQRANLNLTQLLHYFNKIRKLPGGSAYYAIFALPAAIEANLTIDQTIDLFVRIIMKTKWAEEYAFAGLPAALEANLNPDQIVTLFGRIMEQGNNAGFYFPELSAALPAARKANLTFGQILDLFSKIVNKTKPEYLNSAFNALPIIFEAKLTPDQIISIALAGWETPQAKKIIFKYLKEHYGITKKLIELVEKLGLIREITFLLNDPETPEEINHAILKIAREQIAKSWSHILNGRPAEELPHVFEFCARVMAEKALFAYDKIRKIATQTKKPTITVYVLSTAYKLMIERLSDQFREQGLTREEIALTLKTFKQDVRKKIKAGKPNVEARLEVGKEWLKKGLLTRFTLPVLLKIPSGSDPAVRVAQRLQELSCLAEENNYDIIFIDHSTIRTKAVVHKNDPHDFEKGRAIARALDIVDPFYNRRGWLYRQNDWQIPELDHRYPNMIGLNLYDGIIYDSHTGGQKSDWLPVDDHGEFVGASWDAEGKMHRTNYLVFTRNADGRYHVQTAAQIFNCLLRDTIKKLKEPKERIRIPHRNILFVCNANHVRSPLAEHMMRKKIEEKVEGAERIRVSSAGLAVKKWLQTKGRKEKFPYLPSSDTRHLLERSGIDYQNFRKRQLDQSMVAQANIIFVMTRREKKVLLKKYPDAHGKVFVLRVYADYEKQDRDIPTPRTFNYQTKYIFEEALDRALQRMAGESISVVRRLPKKPFRGRPHHEGIAA